MNPYCKSVENKYMKKVLLFSLAVIAIFGILNTKTVAKFLPSVEEQKTSVQTVDWSAVEIDRVEVYKSKRLLQVLDDDKVIKTYKMRLGFAPTGHKTTEGDGKTPEGQYVLDWRNPNSQFYKSLHISYPNAGRQGNHCMVTCLKQIGRGAVSPCPIRIWMSYGGMSKMAQRLRFFRNVLEKC